MPDDKNPLEHGYGRNEACRPQGAFFENSGSICRRRRDWNAEASACTAAAQGMRPEGRIIVSDGCFVPDGRLHFMEMPLTGWLPEIWANGFIKEDGLELPRNARAVPGGHELRTAIGHFSIGILRVIDRPYQSVTRLRDSVERVVSHACFLDLQDPLSLQEFAKNVRLKESDNDPSRRRAGTNPAIGGRTTGTLTEAMRHLDARAVVGVVTRFNATLARPGRRFQWANRVECRAHNANPKRSVTDRISSSAIVLFRRGQELEPARYGYAHKLLGRVP